MFRTKIVKFIQMPKIQKIKEKRKFRFAFQYFVLQKEITFVDLT